MRISISLSDYQEKVLERFATARSNWYMPLSEAHTIKQGTFRSMLVQQWIAFHRELGEEGGFQVTEAGKERWLRRKEINVFRSEAQFSRPLTAYFDPKAYGLRVVHKRKNVA